MAFEQFFYTTSLKISISGKSNQCQGERVSGGNLVGGTAIVEITPMICGGITCDAEANTQSIFGPLAEGGFGGRWPNGRGEDTIIALDIITVIPEGGMVVGGLAVPLYRFSPDVFGGVLVDGHGFSAESRPADGGVLAGGKALVSKLYTEIGSGGILIGGKPAEEPLISGGILGGGVAIVVIEILAQGGIVSGGVVEEFIVDDIIAIGGVIAGGDGHNIENITITGGSLAGGISLPIESSIGGAVIGGQATTSYDEVGLGGAIIGGIALKGTHDFGTGGALIHGSVIQRITQHIEGAGVIVGGKLSEEPETIGGVILGGIAGQTYDEIGAGGALAGGTNNLEISPLIGGGILVGGIILIAEQPAVSGGVFAGGNSQQSFNEVSTGGMLVGGIGFDTQSGWTYVASGFVQVSNAEIIYEIFTAFFVYDVDENTAEVIISGNGIATKRFFGQSIPTFAFGKTPAKNEACRSFREVIRQPTVLAMTRTKTREWLEKLDPDDWSISSFDPIKREVCILVDNGHGLTHLITAELLLIGAGVGSP